MATLYTDRTARKEHACIHGCGDPIRPGERYVVASLTPGDPEVSNTGWWSGAVHGRDFYDCPSRQDLPGGARRVTARAEHDGAQVTVCAPPGTSPEFAEGLAAELAASARIMTGPEADHG